MNKDNKTESNTGIIVRGYCISSTAVCRERKDGSGRFVVVRDEFALKPGMAVMETMYDPAKDLEISLEGDRVTKFPKLEDFKLYEIKVDQFKSSSEGNMIIRKGIPGRVD